MDDDDANSGSKSFRSTNLVVGGGVTWFTPYSDKVSINLEALYFAGDDKKKFKDDSISNETDEGDFARINGNATLKLGVNYSF